VETHQIELVSRSPDETRKIGRVLGSLAQPGFVYLLTGELGAGKTCLTQGVLLGLGGNEYARSPSFVYVTQYQARLTLYHIDLYRLEDGSEAQDLGLDEYLSSDGLCTVEWADRSPWLFTRDSLNISIEHIDENGRRMSLSTRSQVYTGVLDAVKSCMCRR